MTFDYSDEPPPQVIERLVQTGLAPVYVVHFTQKDAVERAQLLLSTKVAPKKVASKEEKARIADALPGRGVPHRRGGGDHHLAGRTGARDRPVVAEQVGTPQEP